MSKSKYRNQTPLSAIPLALLAALNAPAAVTYVGDTYIPGNGVDSSGLPATILEDGVSPENALNGFGSGLSFAGGNSFYALCDRGPNKVVYNASVDNTTSFPNRFQHFTITLAPQGSLTNGVYASYAVTATATGTSLLKTPKGQQYIGLSTAYARDSTQENRRLDPEGIRVAPDGSVWVSDEYGPWILHFDAQGHQIGSLPAPAGFRDSIEDSTGAKEDAENAVGRTDNKGAEGLAITPDGNTLVVLMQSPLLQDSTTNGLNNRLLVYDLQHPTVAPKQYIYPLDNTSQSVSELLAYGNHQFLVDERNSKGGKKGIKLLYAIDIQQDTLPTDLATTAYDGTTKDRGLPGTTIPSGVMPLRKTLFASIGQILLSATPWPFNASSGLDSLPDKLEGYAFGPDLPDGRHLLLVTNDNDFVQPGGVVAGAGYPNYVFAFAVDPSDLMGFQSENFGTTGLSPRKTGSTDLTAVLGRNSLELRSSLSGDARVQLLDVSGAVVEDLGLHLLIAGENRLALPSSLRPGVYILKATGEIRSSTALTWF
jgi:hypothetical protein